MKLIPGFYGDNIRETRYKNKQLNRATFCVINQMPLEPTLSHKITCHVEKVNKVLSALY